MNLSGFGTAVDRRTGVAVDATARTELINEALLALSTEFDWPWLQRTYTFTTTGADDYSLPFGVDRIRYVTIDGDEPPRGDVVDSDIDNGKRQWSVWADRLIVPVSTGATVKVRYHSTENALESDGDEPYLPEQYHSAVVELAVSLVLDRHGDGSPASVARSVAAEKKYQDWLRRMRRGVSRAAGPRAARVRPGSLI